MVRTNQIYEYSLSLIAVFHKYIHSAWKWVVRINEVDHGFTENKVFWAFVSHGWIVDNKETLILVCTCSRSWKNTLLMMEWEKLDYQEWEIPFKGCVKDRFLLNSPDQKRSWLEFLTYLVVILIVVVLLNSYGESSLNPWNFHQRVIRSVFVN